MLGNEELSKLLVEPITLNTLEYDKHFVYSDKSNEKYTINENGCINFISSAHYDSKEYEEIQKIINFWDSGWSKRLKESDHTPFSSLDKSGLVDEAHRTYLTHKKRKGYGNLFSTEINFDDLENKIGLNIGCGDGAEANLFISRGKAKIIAIDITKHATDAAQNIMNKLESGIAIQADSRYLPIASNSVDFVYSGGVIHHSPNIKKSISEIYRVLKPNGVAYVALYSNTSHHFMYIKLKAILAKNFSKKSINNYLSNYTERSWETNGKKNPHTRTFGYSECYNLFSTFKNTHVRKGNFYAKAFSEYFIKLRLNKIIYKLLNKFEKNKLLSLIGMMIVIKATK